MQLRTSRAIATLVFSIALSAYAQTKNIDIQAHDGTNLKVSYYSPGHAGPAILLLHQCNMDRHAWEGLASDLAGAGFHVLTVDYRGYGESGGQPYKDANDRRTAMQEKWPGDVDAAYAYLLAQKGVYRSQVLAGGASCGVTQSADLAVRHPEIRGLVLLSGSASDTAKSYIASNPKLAVFGAASDGDTNAAKGIKDAVEASKNSQSTLKIYSGKEHGVPMFDKNPDLKPMLVSWAKAQVDQHKGTQ
jgi:dienelactone hydrolase